MLPSSSAIPRDSSPVKYCLKMVNSWFIYKCILFSSAPQQHMSGKKVCDGFRTTAKFPNCIGTLDEKNSCLDQGSPTNFNLGATFKK